MPSELLITGDQAVYLPQFGAATVQVQPGVLIGSASKFKVRGQPACVRGDEASAQVPGCPYVAQGYPIPGTGRLSIARLGPDHLVSAIKLNELPFIVKGGHFVAEFEVTRPAQIALPNGSLVPDPTPRYAGRGYFEKRNIGFKLGETK